LNTNPENLIKIVRHEHERLEALPALLYMLITLPFVPSLLSQRQSPVIAHRNIRDDHSTRKNAAHYETHRKIALSATRRSRYQLNHDNATKHKYQNAYD
jgi:hypothetical protein